METDIRYGTIFAMTSRNVISRKGGTIDVNVRNRHFEQYADRRDDLGFEQEERNDRGILPGEVAIISGQDYFMWMSLIPMRNHIWMAVRSRGWGMPNLQPQYIADIGW